MSTEPVQIEKKKTLVPQVRFKGYDLGWKNYSLKKLINELNSGISVNSEDFPIQTDFEVGILKTSCVANGIFREKENKKIVENEISRAKLNPSKNEIIISRMNTPQLVGESGYIDRNYPSLFIPDRLWQTIVNQELCVSRWLSYFLITEKVRDNLKSIATGTSGTMKNISKPNFLSIHVSIPTLEEQQKIASFLSAVDEKIHQLSRKKELLEQYKKGLMQQLFSGKLRFKDDNGKDYADWEEKKLGEVAKFYKGKGISKSEISEDGKNECIRYGELYTRYGEVIQDVISKTNFDINKAVVSQANDVIIPASGETQIDIATASCVMKSGVILGGDLNIIRTNNNGIFLSYYLNSVRKLDIANLAQGISVVHLYSSQLALLNLNLPTLPEQQKIANFLSNIDTKIETTNQQINQTQSFKKGLLQQMFV